MTAFVLASLISLSTVQAVPTESHLEDRVDLIEVNHLYDLSGRPVIHQMIFYQWDRVTHRFQVRAWRLLKSNDQLPQRNWSQDNYVSQWRDLSTMRKVYAENVRETWTIYDPEVLERQMLPIDRRVDLSRPHARSD